MNLCCLDDLSFDRKDFGTSCLSCGFGVSAWIWTTPKAWSLEVEQQPAHACWKVQCGASTEEVGGEGGHLVVFHGI